MSDPVKTHRVIRSEMKVGDTVRIYGDFVPEAATWPNLHAYIRNGYVEETYVSQETIDANLEEIRNRPKADPDVNFEESETSSPVAEAFEIEEGLVVPPVLDYADPEVLKQQAKQAEQAKSPSKAKSKKSVKIKKSKSVRSAADEQEEPAGASLEEVSV